MIGRRGFLKAIGVGVLGLSLALRRPEASLDFAPPKNDTGIAIRFIRNWDAVSTADVTRVDVLYGYGQIQPQLVCRITDAPSWVERMLSVFKRAA